ncbi:MAG: hypothetical protein V8T51_01815 [Senegalimassilia faecalis]
MVSKDDILSMLDQARESMGDMADTLIAQQGIAAARAEYEQLGFNMDDMQMSYLLSTGAKMLALAALGMLVAVIVGFLASRTAAKVGRSLRERLFNKVVAFPTPRCSRSAPRRLSHAAPTTCSWCRWSSSCCCAWCCTRPSWPSAASS